MTNDNTTQPGVRVDSSLWEEFRQDVKERRGGVRGHMKTELENALSSYIQASKGGDITDRLRRLENAVKSIDEQVGAVVDGQERKKKKDSGVSDTVKNRVEQIGERIEREANGAPKVHESIVNNAIEDIAGSSRPTLNRYKEMLEQRHIAHEWPVDDANHWWVDTSQFVRTLESNFPNQNQDFSKKYGGEWWDAQLPDDDPERGIQ